MAVINVNLNSQPEKNQSSVKLKNIEALTLEVGDVPWYDFINNYWGESQKIAVKTEERISGFLIHKGTTISISRSVTYTYVVYTPCYDGKDKNECTSDKKTYL
ncbi:MAG: hypothetical protein LBG92_05375 [Prevotellaceae bacterium]|nr:hypothetical protein [Prevotellaceae bacterium]